jgi:hypothetical protein
MSARMEPLLAPQGLSCRHRRGYLIGGLVLAAVLIVGAVAAQRLLGATRADPASAATSRDTLAADPAAALRMSGADELAHIGDQSRTSADGTTPAFEGRIFGTQAAASNVREFYSQQLAALGWRPDDRGVVRSSVELGVSGWCRPERTFRLAFKDPQRAFTPEFYHGQTYTVVFDARLIASTPSDGCAATGG